MDEAAARALIAEHLAVPHTLVVDQADFRDLGADSLDVVTLTMQLEEAFDLHIPDEQVDRCTSVGEAIEILRIVATARRGELQRAG